MWKEVSVDHRSLCFCGCHRGYVRLLFRRCLDRRCLWLSLLPRGDFSNWALSEWEARLTTGKRAPADNSRRAQIGGLIDLAREKHLTVYEIVVEPRCIRIRTQPLGESPAPEDAADKWLRGKLDASASRGRS